MKIKISYQKDEISFAQEIENVIKRRSIPENSVKVTKSDRHEPFFHTYPAIKNNGNPHK